MRLRESRLNDSIQEQIDLEESNSDDKETTEKKEISEENSKSHTNVLDNLVKQVQIFSDDEDFIPKKKKGKIIFIIFFLLLIAIGVVFSFYYLKPFDQKEKSKESEKKNDNAITENYRYEVDSEKITFYNNDEQIDSYLCVNECSIYSEGSHQYFSKSDHVIALKDGENVFLYDFVDKKEVTDNFVKLENLLADDKTVAFLASNATGEMGVIDNKGNVVIPIEYGNLGYSFGGGEVTDYSYDKNVITAFKDGSWGLITLDKGEVKIPFEYDDIYFNGYDAVVVKKEGLWYLLDFDGNQILANGYNMIIPINSYIFVARDDIFQVLNYKGERVVSKDIPTYVNGFRGRVTSEVPIFKISVEGTIVTIYIMKSDEDSNDYSTYQFNTVNGVLTEVIS